MGSFLILMWKPLLACLILTGIHTYLGVHVVERKVIFVDLALAQIAALGAVLAFMFGFSLHGHATYWFSLGATFIGAIIFSMTRTRREKIPQEAIIGIVYAVAAAAAVLILSRAAEGDEEIRQTFRHATCDGAILHRFIAVLLCQPNRFKGVGVLLITLDGIRLLPTAIDGIRRPPYSATVPAAPQPSHHPCR